MQVKLVSITGSCIEPSMSPEDIIVYTARVSNPENQMNFETSGRLLKYLVNNNHWSPFEMVDMTVEIKTSRAIAQQIIRHRSFSFQEFSQRYSVSGSYENIELREKADKNRQSSINVFNPNISYANGIDAQTVIDAYISESNKLYNSLLDAGVAKECARMVLPLATQTTIYMKGSVRSWIHYLQIRLDGSTQKEHREVAKEVQKIFKEKFPTIHENIFKNE